jgi:hypothetical protein
LGSLTTAMPGTTTQRVRRPWANRKQWARTGTYSQACIQKTLAMPNFVPLENPRMAMTWPTRADRGMETKEHTVAAPANGSRPDQMLYMHIH